MEATGNEQLYKRSRKISMFQDNEGNDDDVPIIKKYSGKIKSERRNEDFPREEEKDESSNCDTLVQIPDYKSEESDEEDE